MSTAYYIVDEKVKNIRKKEYENLLDLIEKIDDTVEIYCADGKLSVGTLEDIQNSLNTWKWFVDTEYGYYRFLQTTAMQSSKNSSASSIVSATGSGRSCS